MLYGCLHQPPSQRMDAGRGTDRGGERRGGAQKIHCCRIPSPELNPLMLRSKFMKEEGESERGQREMKEKQTEFKSEKSQIRQTWSREETAGEEGIWNLCDGMKREKSNYPCKLSHRVSGRFTAIPCSAPGHGPRFCGFRRVCFTVSTAHLTPLQVK